MPQQVCMGAMLSCTFGAAPSSLNVLPINRVLINNMPAANIMDHQPMVNVSTFGMCNSPANPQVAVATAAAMGVLTPMPCIPVTVSPWTPGCTKTTIANMPALNNACTLNCMWGGVITFSQAGQISVNVT